MVRKLKLILKLIASQDRKQTIEMHILHDISRSKGNQTMKFSQVIKYNMRNSFLEKSYSKCGRKTFPEPFLNNQN